MQSTRKIERALAFHVTGTSPEPFLVPALRVRPPPPARHFLLTIGAPHTPSLAIFLLHVTHLVIYVIAPFIFQLIVMYYYCKLLIIYYYHYY